MPAEEIGGRREERASRWRPGRQYVVTVFAAVLGLSAWAGYSSIRIDAEQQHAREHVEAHISDGMAALDAAVRLRTGLLTGLESYVHGSLDAADGFAGFEALASGYASAAAGIRTIQISPDGVNEYVYPSAGNEGVLGHDLLTDERPDVQADIERMLATGEQNLSGPYELRQGGLGLVSRRPIYRDDAFWGLVAIVVDMPPVLAEAGLDCDAHNAEITTLVDGEGPFCGPADILEHDPVSVDRVFYGDRWIVASAPLDGWRARAVAETRTERWGALLLVVIVTGGTWLVASRNVRLRDTNRQLAQADATKDDFLAAMSHELRTPLNSIIGYSGILLSGEPGPVTDEQDRQLGMISASGQRLLAIVNDVLDLSRIRAGATEVTLAELDVATICETAVDEIRPQVDASRVTLICETDVERCCPTGTVWSDPDKVDQILLNLLTNAAKFTPEGTITIAATCTDQRLVISVTDTGIGVDPDDVDRIFDEFQQVEAAGAVKPPGTGLGLPISQRLAHMLGGKVTYERPAAGGSTFSLELPLDHPDAKSRGARS